MTKSAEIIEFVREQGTPGRLPGAWASLPRDPALFDLPKDREELLRRLLERFTRRELLRAGVVQTDSDGRVALSGLLATNDSYLCALEKPRGNTAVRSLGGRGRNSVRQVANAGGARRRGILGPRRARGGRLFPRPIGGRRGDCSFAQPVGRPRPTKWSIWAARASSCSARKWTCR